MKATWEFEAKLRAHPGKGDEIIPLVSDARYQDEVPVGGLLRHGAAS